jgi:hypothetical protein
VPGTYFSVEASAEDAIANALASERACPINLLRHMWWSSSLSFEATASSSVFTWDLVDLEAIDTLENETAERVPTSAMIRRVRIAHELNILHDASVVI